MAESLGSFDVVAFGPHPDDVEMGIAGTLIKMVRAGRRILNVCMTRGEKGTYGTVEVRRKEFERANAIMGTQPLMLDFPDTAMVNDYEGKLRVARIVRETRPQVVFAPYHTNPFGHFDGSANVDHFATGELVRDGLKLARFRSLLPDIEPYGVPYLYYYMVPAHLADRGGGHHRRDRRGPRRDRGLRNPDVDQEAAPRDPRYARRDPSLHRSPDQRPLRRGVL
ncbi:MAG: PIG-L family deacetylase [Candidatus Eisenbacteria bacterium]